MNAKPDLSHMSRMPAVPPAPLPAPEADPQSGEWDNVLGCGAPGPDRGQPALFNQAPADSQK